MHAAPARDRERVLQIAHDIPHLPQKTSSIQKPNIVTAHGAPNLSVGPGESVARAETLRHIGGAGPLNLLPTLATNPWEWGAWSLEVGTGATITIRPRRAARARARPALTRLTCRYTIGYRCPLVGRIYNSAFKALAVRFCSQQY